MTNPRLRPPADDAAPRLSDPLGGAGRVDLVLLATETCRRYEREFPDEQTRYGDAGLAWCIHDNQHLINWATQEVLGHLDLNEEVTWLASVLESRGFPLDRLARNLDLAAAVTLDQLSGQPSADVADVLTRSASYVRSHGTFL